MDWMTKVWGRTREVVDSPFYSRHELEVVAGGYCSLHYHRQRSNRFSVISATLEIVELFGPLVRRTPLGPENTYDVPSLVPHLFIVYKPGLLFEEYYADRGGTVRRDDIVRLSEGGLKSVEQLGDLPECLYNQLQPLISKIV